MGQRCDIEYCDSSLNLMMGCDGCCLWNPAKGVRHCYAGTLTDRYGGQKGWPKSFDQPALFPERLAKALAWPDLTGKDRPDKPWLNGYPRVIFLNDMGDTFTESLPLDWMAKLIKPMAASPHIWIVLTKRPGRMREFWQRWCQGDLNDDHLGRYRHIPENFWLMTSITSSENIGRVRELMKLRELGAAVLGVSYEPALGAVNLVPWVRYADPPLSWVVLGGESGTGARPSDPTWFRDVRDQCLPVGVSFFMKQITERGHKILFDQWPTDLQVRQMPKVVR